jgi:uncharacterized membrane protein YeaQ/YmgE (transglycosylase-associated protein family)
MSVTNENQPEAPKLSVPSDHFEFDCPYQASGPTTLRCSKCNRPLMAKDAVRTPTGYVCPFYVKARVATFYNAGMEHYVIVAVLALVLGVVAGYALNFMGRIGFFAIILTLFVGPLIGGIVAEVIRRVLGKRRGQYFWLVAAIAMVIGASVFTVLPALFGLLSMSINAIYSLIPLVGLGLAVSALIARMRI